MNTEYRKKLESAFNLGELKDPKTVRKWVLLTRGHECEACGLSEWQDNPIPLDVHHINGDPYDNSPENLSLVCKNCHALTPSFGRKNIGKGRHERRDRYKKGLSR